LINKDSYKTKSTVNRLLTLDFLDPIKASIQSLTQRISPLEESLTLLQDKVSLNEKALNDMKVEFEKGLSDLKADLKKESQVITEVVDQIKNLKEYINTEISKLSSGFNQSIS
jgi:predicted  nucleic acid-binding Zn-ribbon protein